MKHIISVKLHNLGIYSGWIKKLWYPRKKIAYLIASPTHENVGDAAIVMGVKNVLYRAGYEKVAEITTAEYWNYRKCIKKLLPQNALIVLNGGGSMGDIYQLEEMNRRTVLSDFPNHKTVIFPQTIFYTDRQAELESVPHYNRENITICARETVSYETMKKLYPKANILLVPDAVLSMNYSGVKNNRQGIIVCFRGDQEQKLSRDEKERIFNHLETCGYSVTITEMMHGAEIPREYRKEIVESKISLFADAELVITDRLHAMILCAISGTPCLVFGNNHHKVRGVYEWIEHLEYISFVHTTEEMYSKIEEFRAKQNYRYIPRMEDFQNLIEEVAPR